MRIVPSTLAATSDEAPTSQLHLTKLVYDGISRIKENGKCLQHCFSRFHEISGFASLQDWESVFTATSFTHRTSVTTPYGVINSYDITHRLKQNLISRNPSLRQLCIAAVCEVGPPLMTVDILLSLPQNLFQMFFITAFSIHWIPMSHTQFHGDLDKTRKIPSSLWHVLKILSTPQVFERLFDECREVLMFIVCWMQHAHFSPNRDDMNYQPSSDPRDPPNRPILEPHQFSEKLVRVLKKKLAPLTQANDSVPPGRGGLLTTADSVISCLLFGLKVSHFLCDSSEYVHAVRAVRLTRNFLQTVTDERTRLWLDHELYCIMLRSMNSHIMYAERENQLVFQRDVPRLLKSLHQSNLLVSQSDPQKPFSCLALPYAPIADLNRFDSVEIVGVSTPSTRCSQIERKNRKPGTSVNSRGGMLGPSGDTISSVTLEPIHRFFHGKSLNGGFLYAQLATYHYAMCAYEKSFQFSVLAIEQIRACSNNPPGVSGHVVVEVLRVVCKLCMIKREYKLALAIIKSALSFTSHVYGSSNLTYANLLLDYGCLLLNADKTRKAAQVYATGICPKLQLSTWIQCCVCSSIGSNRLRALCSRVHNRRL
ncbi:hypothetical protein FGIG_09736 [Fasciola gigantica]|uniref:Uncharacterized protein n=1 Tax=Fasciola gigantica TaxID=46835 RepID=A0A504YPC1_FASGI|nr:hypothetical protein FGIG_09736 [Fasciola gigantica]